MSVAMGQEQRPVPESPAPTAAAFACPRDERERLAVTNHTRRYRTWAHAAYAVGYDGVSKTLCGRRFSDPYPEARGPGAWGAVSCPRCLKGVARLEREGSA
jgi:hypothetical protein